MASVRIAVTLGSVALYVALHLALVGRIGNATGLDSRLEEPGVRSLTRCAHSGSKTLPIVPTGPAAILAASEAEPALYT